jgi:3-oxoacyl-[acyl-carrier protein] reductase
VSSGNRTGGGGARIRADVCDYEQVSAAVERMRVQFGSTVQVLVCSAAILGPIGPFVDTSPKAWQDIVQTNLIGVMNACRAVLPNMIERRNGKIIVIAGVGGVLPARPNFAVHSATKTAVVRFVESLAAEVADYNVQINCLSPGETYTHMTDQVLAPANARDGELESARQVRMTGGVPGKQIALAHFLASPELITTGRMIHVGDDWKKLKEKPSHPSSTGSGALQNVSAGLKSQCGGSSPPSLLIARVDGGRPLGGAWL